MPYYRRRRTGIKRRYRRKPKLATKRYVAKQFRKHTEVKWATSTASASVTNAVTVTQITVPGQGTARNQRIGNVLRWINLYGKVNVTAADTTNNARFIILQWNPDDALDTCTAAQVLQDPTTLPWISPYNPVTKYKFKVLYDTNFQVSAQGPAIVQRKFYIRRVPRKAILNEGTNNGKGTMYMLRVSDSGAATHPVMEHSFVYKWADD